jgi:hypothetical protein
MNLNEPHHLSPSARKTRDNIVMAFCIIWIVASVIGFAVGAFAATPTGLRGAQTAPPSSPAAPAKKSRPSRAMPVAKTVAANTPQAWLGASIWRAGPCASAQNFQAFSFTAEPKVEVGSGKPGEGERLELLRISTDDAGLIQIETRVCAPVGCNQTIERYKKLGPDQMQEWHFEGRLPNITPYVIVANGAAVDGSGPGRVFNRCGA